MRRFGRGGRGSESANDERLELDLTELWSDIRIDPLFRRRLRDLTVRRSVELRSISPAGAGTGAFAPRSGARRLGMVARGCVYAGVVVALSGTTVLALSREALPGDALYGVKLRVEELRLALVPAHLQGALALDALGERLRESNRLAHQGRTAEAVALQPRIIDQINRLAADGDLHDGAAPPSESSLTVLHGVVDRLPGQAKDGIERAWNQLSSGNGREVRSSAGREARTPDAAPPCGTGGGCAEDAPGRTRQGPAATPSPRDRAIATPRPSRSDHPTTDGPLRGSSPASQASPRQDEGSPDRARRAGG